MFKTVKYRMVSAVTILVLAGCLFVSCGKKESKNIVVEGDVTITVQCVSFIDYYTKYAMEMYEAEHPNVKFEILDPIEWSEKDIGLSKVYTEMSQGGGPDIILAGREDLISFVEKDCFLDISDAISEDTNEKLINSVLEYGRFDGKMYLAPNNLNTTMMIVSDSNVYGESWTVEEFIDAIEKRENEGTPYEWIAISDAMPCEAIDVFDIIMYCIDDSYFIDWEGKTCCFDDSLFIKVLEISKKYNDYANAYGPSARNLEEEMELLKDGRVLAICTQTTKLLQYSEESAILGSGYSRIGYPCDNGSGRISVYATNIGVNKNTDYSAVINDFINYYYSLDICIESGSEIRTDLYDGRIDYNEFMDAYGIVKKYEDGSSSFTEYVVKQDGNSYAKEYFELLNTFGVSGMENYNKTIEVKEIVYDEAESYFSGDKSAEEVAGLIQARVKLLLNE